MIDIVKRVIQTKSFILLFELVSELMLLPQTHVVNVSIIKINTDSWPSRVFSPLLILVLLYQLVWVYFCYCILLSVFKLSFILNSSKTFWELISLPDIFGAHNFVARFSLDSLPDHFLSKKSWKVDDGLFGILGGSNSMLLEHFINDSQIDLHSIKQISPTNLK